MTTKVDSKLLEPIESWFARQSWEPLDFQKNTWDAYLNGESGLLNVPTGSGKTYAALMGPLAEMIEEGRSGLQLLYLTPLRAVSRDIEKSIQKPIFEMSLDIRVESRTGDTKSSLKAKQLKKMPEILITTPESLSLLFTYKDHSKLFKNLKCVVVDEWHELMGSKRGTQTDLCMAHLREINSEFRTWALSATIANLEEAAQTAVGLQSKPHIVRSNLKRPTIIESLIPEDIDTFPWAGHLGMKMLPKLIEALDIERSTLLFTNTRWQAERWYLSIISSVPEHEPLIALHHSSIDREEREQIEHDVKEGIIKWVVCTSSLDLGVDFQPVERVVQIGSAKAIARVLQRAGRSAHIPEGTAEILFLPTHAFELLEISAVRRAVADGVIEKRQLHDKPYDVLLQHLVTLACGEGFEPDEVFDSIRNTQSYKNLSREEYDWILDLIEKGGRCLKAYPEYKKVKLEADRYVISEKRQAQRHRMSIGTITSDQHVQLRFRNGKRVGDVEERFIAWLKPGDRFFFAGKQLEFLSAQGMTAYVKATKKKTTTIPSWGGTKFPISDMMSDVLRRELSMDFDEKSPEHAAILPVLEAQARISHVPKLDELLLEICETSEGRHLFIYPFEGRYVHEGLAAIWSTRLAQKKEATFSLAVNDYGLEILATDDYPFEDLFDASFFKTENLAEDIAQGINLSELAARRFRGISQIAGLVFRGYPWSEKTVRQLQVSSSLLYDVFQKYEPDNLLLKQAERELLEKQLEASRLRASLERLASLKLIWAKTSRPSPLGFPLVVEFLTGKLTNEKLTQRISRMKEQWEKQ
jgi:ATP-dependent Lhr-like helicase